VSPKENEFIIHYGNTASSHFVKSYVHFFIAPGYRHSRRIELKPLLHLHGIKAFESTDFNNILELGDTHHQ